MSVVVTIACLFAQQLDVKPIPAHVGEPVVVTVTRGQVPAAGIEVAVELPGGTSRPVGPTDIGGRVRFEAEAAGRHAFVASIDGVRCVAPVVIAPRSNRWLLALGSVPLGLALLWLQLRRLVRDRQRCPDSAARKA